MKLLFALCLTTALLLGLATGSEGWWLFTLCYVFSVAVTATILSKRRKET